MKKTQIIVIGFLGLGLIDSLITFGFPIDFTYTAYSVIPHFTFIGTLIYLHDKEWLNRVLIGALIGALFDALFANTFLIYMVLFALGAYLIGCLRPWMRTEPRKIWIYWAFAFLFDLLPYVTLRLFSSGYPRFLTWMLRVEAATLVLDAATILFLMYAGQVMSRFFKIRDLREQKKVRQKIKRAKFSRK